MLDTWTGPGHQRQVVEIAGCPLAASVMAAAAALEVAVHGWDISRACGQRQPIPRALAIDLLAVAPVLVPRAPPPTVCEAGYRGGYGRPQRPARRLPRALPGHSALISAALNLDQAWTAAGTGNLLEFDDARISPCLIPLVFPPLDPRGWPRRGRMGPSRNASPAARGRSRWAGW